MRNGIVHSACPRLIMQRISLCSVFLCSIFIGYSYGCLPNLTGGGSSSGGCCPPGPSCPQTNHCSASYVSPPVSGPTSYAVPPSYVQPPQQYAQPPPAAVPPPPSPKYPTPVQ
ncbi:hypothetical protein L5515_001397 [Caenorhabditis briggsae]|uniref:Uncharacterized protein n=1 Tax=Caenorhabditis briggsae TaxID=6238 RepID=A0AAE9J3B4_CAEBR|nr:hypothetical protein L5515_001397 [Caenorhabditis briggsae]